MGVLLKMLNLKLVLVLVTVIGQINCRPKAFRSSGHQLSPEAQRKLAEFRTMLEASEGNTGASDNAADAADPSADTADLTADTADPMADAADMADPMADAADTTADAADTAVDAADAADADAADAANPAAADRADASDPNGIAADGPIPYGPGGLETDVVDPDGNVMDGPQNPGSGYDGKNGMLGKLMVSIMEKLGNGEPIKMIVDVKNPQAMISKSK